jgi:two-component system cell cycle sensor histidine kinase/response regulator CckA
VLRRRRSGERDPTVESLRRDLADLQRMLQDYMLEREIAEEALRESEERYRSIFLRAAYGIFRASPEGHFLEVNPALVAMLGYASSAEVLALGGAEDLYPDPGARRHVDPPAERAGSEGWFETRWRRADDSSITVRLSIRAKRDREHNVVYYEGIAEDVTERQRREELLRRSERMASLGTTLAGVAHELNNPLAAVIGFAQILLRSVEEAEYRSGLQTIFHEARRASHIVKDLLTFARRQEAGQRASVSLNDIVDYIMSTRRYALETRGIVLELALAPSLPAVVADPTQIEQVVLNLVVNAEQALVSLLDVRHDAGEDDASPRRQGRITVRTALEGNVVSLEVADTGIGIAPEDLPRIWDPFWTTKAEGEGTGLGLPVVHGIISSLGGSIEVTSGVGEGTRFHVRLPAADSGIAADVTVSRGEDADVPEQAIKPLDILVVDDEDSILRFLEHYLSSRGHAVLAASDGAKALKLAERMDFDVVVCDIRMPGMDGYEVLTRLRALPNGERVRCIVSTGVSVDPAGQTRLDDLGVAAVIAKPYEIEQLREVVEAADSG